LQLDPQLCKPIHLRTTRVNSINVHYVRTNAIDSIIAIKYQPD